MFSTKQIALALGGTALAAVPAQAGGLLGGGGGNCLCQAVGGLLGNAPNIGKPSSGTSGRGSIVGNVSGSVSKSLNLTAKRSISRRNGSFGGHAGLAGTVNGLAGAIVKVNGISKSVGLAGSATGSAQWTQRGAGTGAVRSLRVERKG